MKIVILYVLLILFVPLANAHGELYKDRVKMRALMKGALDTAIFKGANGANAIAMGYCLVVRRYWNTLVLVLI